MTEKTPEPKRNVSPDWLVRGALTKIGDTFDRFLGRKWVPSSSLATSELIERVKRLLDSEAKEVLGKGLVVPHEITLKVQWNKFSTEGEEVVQKLENELLVATADHINDSRYYTFAPLNISVEPDYFIEGVKLATSFGRFSEQPAATEMNVTLAGVDLAKTITQIDDAKLPARACTFTARYRLSGAEREKALQLLTGRSISIGRAGSNELVLDDNSVSKIHASLSVDSDGKLQLADTGSTNGTFLNGERIAYGKAITLNDSDKIAFGDVEVMFERLTKEIEPGSDEDIAQAPTIEIDGLQFTTRESAEDEKPSASEPDEKNETGVDPE